MLDAKVAYGQNIVEAETAYTELKKSDTTIKFFYIPETAIKETAVELTQVPGTMSLYQLRNSKQGLCSIP